jgi:hypothetical protein
MGRSLALIACALCSPGMTAYGQASSIAHVQVVAGKVLSFHLQSRLNPDAGNVLDVLPQGTVLYVRMSDSIDSTVDPDGAPFRGSLVSSVMSGDRVVVHSDAGVYGLLALLRSRNHPDGFRYELLITHLVDHGRSYTLTASLDPSFFDPTSNHESKLEAGHKQ